MEKLMRMLFGFKEIKFRTDDDFFDRLSRRHTTCLLLLFSLVITTKQYVGDPIHCWCPAQFTDTHKAYANTICWVKNTYFVPLEEPLPMPQESRHMISYYQWVPMILLCQAIVCYIPSIIWRFLCKRSGLNVAAIMDAAIAGQRTSYADIREKTTRYIVHQVDKYLVARVDRGKGCFNRIKHTAARYCCLVYGKFYGNYLCVCYLSIKICFVLNAVGQLFMLDAFLGTNYHMYGIEVVKRFVNKDDWTISERFPRVTMCDFQVRHMNQLHRYVVQCVLPINLFNEKIFIFIWFWYAFLSVSTIISFFKWLWNLTFWPGQIQYVKRSLRASGCASNKKDRDIIEKFAAKYLKRDGIFIIRLIGNNIGHLVASEVLSGLWENYGPEHRLLQQVQQEQPVRPQRLTPRATSIRLNSLAERLEAV